MKWLFIVAVLLNMAYFSYNIFFGEGTVTKKVIANKSEKNQIILLSELDADNLKKLQEKTAAPKQASQRTFSSTAQGTPDKEGQTKTEHQSDLAPEQESLTNASVAAAQTEDTAISSCYKLGPFTKEEMDEIRLVLEKDYQNKLSFGIETTSTTTYYRIYIPPLQSKSKIKDTLEKLNDSGMKDHYVMSINGRKNAIALGVFKKRGAAEKIAAKANKAGFSTTIEAISDDKNSQYKLQLVFQENADLTRYQELIASKNLKSAECEK